MLKKLLLSSSLLFISHLVFSQGVAINEDNSSAAASAILDIKSTTKGMLAPRMTAAQKTAITSPATGLLIYQTDGTAGFYYYNGSAWTFINAAGQNGLNSLSRTSVETAGANCATGGIKVEYGLDLNSNGVLNVGEENATLTKYVCNGATGATGSAGANGLNSLSRTTTEAAGANCTNGGVKVEYGLDTNSNGTLDAGEVNATLTKYVCNGAAGATGATGATGQGVPVGGTAGQVLTKINSTNYNTQWTTVSGGGSLPTQTGNAGKYLTTDGTNANWAALQNTSLGTLKDANNVVLGKVISIGTGEVTVVSSTGYFYSIGWDGAFPDGQIYYSSTTCGVGTSRWLNAGTTFPYPRYVKFVVHDPPTGNFYITANADANGISLNVPFTANSIWNYGSCSSGSQSNGGWLLTPITKAAAGIPTTITPPFTIE